MAINQQLPPEIDYMMDEITGSRFTTDDLVQETYRKHLRYLYYTCHLNRSEVTKILHDLFYAAYYATKSEAIT